MCAGAVREAVFSNPDVIRRVQEDFVPVALSMLSPLQRTQDQEGELFRSICKSRIQLQGTCVLNSAGQVLAWVLTYDRQEKVLEFLDHTLDRFREFPSGDRPITIERYDQFSTARAADQSEPVRPSSLPFRHPKGEPCRAEPPLAPGTLVAKVIGRALDADGGYFTDTVKQEHYALDRFEVGPEVQRQFASAVRESTSSRVRLPESLARRIMAAAYLGNKDMGPLT